MDQAVKERMEVDMLRRIIENKSTVIISCEISLVHSAQNSLNYVVYFQRSKMRLKFEKSPLLSPSFGWITAASGTLHWPGLRHQRQGKWVHILKVAVKKKIKLLNLFKFIVKGMVTAQGLTILWYRL